METPIRILFVEDDKTRWEIFSEVINKKSFVELFWAKTAKQAIKQLDSGYWDIICLDHDLGRKSFMDSFESNTGYEVAKHINDDVRYNDELIFIHSWNPVGADNIKRLLKKSMYLPFNKDFAQIISDHADYLFNKKVESSLD